MSACLLYSSQDRKQGNLNTAVAKELILHMQPYQKKLTERMRSQSKSVKTPSLFIWLGDVERPADMRPT